MKFTFTNLTQRKIIKPIRILQVVGSMDRGGAESWLMNILRTIDREKFQIEFCALRGRKGIHSAEIESLNSKVIVCPGKPIISFGKRFSKLLSEGRYDVVHSHVWSFSGLILRLAQKNNVPVRISHSHNTFDKHRPAFYRKIYKKIMLKLILNYASHCLGCSREAMNALYGKDWELNPKCKLLYCSINLASFRPDQKKVVRKADFGIAGDEFVIGNVGNLRTQKNHIFLLDIAAEFLKIRPRVYFILVGSGPLEKELKDKAEEIGIADKILFAGIREDVPQLMINVFDALLFPSLYEGMPLVLVESAASGLRALCSETITKDATDFFPEAFVRFSLNKSAKEWAEQLNDLLELPPLVQRDCFELTSKSCFSPEVSMGELAKIYEGSSNESNRV